MGNGQIWCAILTKKYVWLKFFCHSRFNFLFAVMALARHRLLHRLGRHPWVLQGEEEGAMDIKSHLPLRPRHSLPPKPPPPTSSGSLGCPLQGTGPTSLPRYPRWEGEDHRLGPAAVGYSRANLSSSRRGAEEGLFWGMTNAARSPTRQKTSWWQDASSNRYAL